MSSAAPCPYCGAPPNTRAFAHSSTCRIYLRWAGGAPKVVKGATLTGRERLTPEGVAARLKDY